VGYKCLSCEIDFLSPFSNSTLYAWNTVHVPRVLHQHLAVHLILCIIYYLLPAVSMPIDNVYLHSILGYTHVHKAYGGVIDRRGQQNIVYGTLVGLTKQFEA
jgi:hypothetical protein